MNRLLKDFNEIIEDDANIHVIFSIAQELVQDIDQQSEECRLLNIITGSSFALIQALSRYKEIRNGKSISNWS